MLWIVVVVAEEEQGKMFIVSEVSILRNATAIQRLQPPSATRSIHVVNCHYALLTLEPQYCGQQVPPIDDVTWTPMELVGALQPHADALSHSSATLHNLRYFRGDKKILLIG
jgi:hypothetical protein